YKAASGTASIASTLSSVVSREVVTLDLSGTAVIGATTTQYNGNNIRGGVTDGAGNFWAGGTAMAGDTTTNGINYLGNTLPAVQVLSANDRWVKIDDSGNLWFSTGAGARGIYEFAGAPVAAAVPSQVVATGAASSPYGFSISPAGNILYI